MNKKKYQDIIAEAAGILSDHNLSDAAATDIADLREDMNDYVCRVPVVGGFSAGKSAFLNTLLERDLLEEAQTPETTIATEILYDDEEYIEAVDDEGTTKLFDIENASAIDPDAWLYLVYHVNTPYLRQYSDIVLVDMPGLDSGLERHNKAISQYIGRASAFILLVSCEDGTVRGSVRDFLREVQPYDRGLCCFVSKTDLRSEESVASVVKLVENTVSAACGDTVPIVPISSVTDQAFREKADQALSFFDPQKLFEQRFRPDMLGILDSATVALANAEQALTLDASEIDERIKRSQQNQSELARQLEKQKKELMQTNKNQLAPTIMHDIRSALHAQADRLADALMVSPEAFSSAATSVIRGALQEAEVRVRESFEDSVEALDLSFIAETEELLSGSILIDATGLTDGMTNQEKSDNARRIYQAVTSVLAIVTDVINPLLELVIILFPSIVEMFRGKQEEKKRERLTQQIETSIIPQIIEKLRPRIAEILDDVTTSMLEGVERRIGQLIQAEETALQQAKSDKVQQETELNGIRESIQADIARLHGMRSQIQPSGVSLQKKAL